ncbi:M1 family metallopeptidase [Streptomyces pactum]|uniref:M1 family metallopeptidase n=1 Tax=Streptomyces pactum TaxID=68249 RepID=UPI0027DC7EE3|nr:M1 family metallopeptidase [Streptomyces pactum]
MSRRPSLRALCGAALLIACTACSGGGDAPRAGSGRAGASGAGDPLFPGLGNGGYDVTHYNLTLDLASGARRLKATADITARATTTLRSFSLDLDGLHVRQATVDGLAATFTRRGTELVVTPRSPLAKGRIFKTRIRYDGAPKTVTDPDGSIEGWVPTADGAVGLGEPAGSMAWFPGNHHPSDKAAYDISVTLPDDGSTAVSNGVLESRQVDGDRRTFRWHVREPMASYLATVAVGDFEVTDTTTADGVPQYDAVDREEREGSQDVTAQVGEILAWQSELFGPYPFAATGVVIDDNPDLGYALETQTRPYFNSAPDELLLVHEFAHQWFGNSVTPRSWRDIWLNEGFATYAEWLWQEQRQGRDADTIFRGYWDGTDRASDGIWAFPPAEPPTAARLLDPPVYKRGAMVLHKVRRAVGDDTFFDILRTWARTHRHRNADTTQFIALCERKAGKDLGPLFDTWLYGNGKPARP